MFQDHIILAFKNIRKRGIRSWLTMLGIFIGIAAVVSLISLGNGLQSAITGQFSQLGTDKLTISNAETGFGPPGATAVRKLTEHDLNLIKRVPGVDIAVPRLVRIGSVTYNKVVGYKYLGSMPNDQKQIDLIYETMNIGVDQGRLLTKDDRKKVVIGSDVIDDSFGKKIRVGSELNIQGQSFQVVGIMKKASSFIVNQVILMPEADMKNILNIGDEIDVIAVKVSNKDMIDATAEKIRSVLRKDRNEKVGEEDFSVQTPQQALSTVNTILVMINAVIAGIAAISLLVGGIGITNTMYTAVLERTKEIGVMKAIGARNADVLTIFLLESALLGLAGGLIGAAIGLGLAFTASFAVTSAFPGIAFGVTISFPLLFEAITFSLLVGMTAGIIPAIQASKLRPVEALRA